MKWRRIIQSVIALTVLCMSCLLFVTRYDQSVGASNRNQIQPYRFPEASARFISNNSPSGNIFNHLKGGGYLIWTLFPSYRIFIDGRTLGDVNVFKDYTEMLWYPHEAARLFDDYGIDIVVIPALNPFTGELYELVNMLAADARWHLVVNEKAYMVFLRGAANDDIIRKFDIPKETIYTHVVEEAEYLLGSGINTPQIWKALRKAYGETGRIAEAKKADENVSIPGRKK